MGEKPAELVRQANGMEVEMFPHDYRQQEYLPKSSHQMIGICNKCHEKHNLIACKICKHGNCSKVILISFTFFFSLNFCPIKK